MKKALLIISLLSVTFVFPFVNWDSLVGYTISDVKNISGWEDSSGKKGDDWQGCDYDRKIIFNDSTYLVCKEYSYSYSYNPEAVIFVKSSYNIKMLVNGQMYKMSTY